MVILSIESRFDSNKSSSSFYLFFNIVRLVLLLGQFVSKIPQFRVLLRQFKTNDSTSILTKVLYDSLRA